MHSRCIAEGPIPMFFQNTNFQRLLKCSPIPSLGILSQLSHRRMNIITIFTSLKHRKNSMRVSDIMIIMIIMIPVQEISCYSSNHHHHPINAIPSSPGCRTLPCLWAAFAGSPQKEPRPIPVKLLPVKAHHSLLLIHNDKSWVLWISDNLLVLISLIQIDP